MSDDRPTHSSATPWLDLDNPHSSPAPPESGPRETRHPAPVQDRTPQRVTLIAGVVVSLTFVFGFGNLWALGERLGVHPLIAPLVAPAVDLSVLGLLMASRYLAVHRATPSPTTARTRTAHVLLCRDLGAQRDRPDPGRSLRHCRLRRGRTAPSHRMARSRTWPTPDPVRDPHRGSIRARRPVQGRTQNRIADRIAGRVADRANQPNSDGEVDSRGARPRAAGHTLQAGAMRRAVHEPRQDWEPAGRPNSDSRANGCRGP